MLSFSFFEDDARDDGHTNAPLFVDFGELEKRMELLPREAEEEYDVATRMASCLATECIILFVFARACV